MNLPGYSWCSVPTDPKPPSRETSILLLNCKSCDDILRLEEDHLRPCLCGQSTARPDARGQWIVAGPARLMSIPFEEYDGAIKGAPRKWFLV